MVCRPRFDFYSKTPNFFFLKLFRVYSRTYDQISSVDNAQIERSGCMKMPKNYEGEVSKCCWWRAANFDQYSSPFSSGFLVCHSYWPRTSVPKVNSEDISVTFTHASGSGAVTIVVCRGRYSNPIPLTACQANALPTVGRWCTPYRKTQPF